MHIGKHQPQGLNHGALSTVQCSSVHTMFPREHMALNMTMTSPEVRWGDCPLARPWFSGSAAMAENALVVMESFSKVTLSQPLTELPLTALILYSNSSCSVDAHEFLPCAQPRHFFFNSRLPVTWISQTRGVCSHKNEVLLTTAL